MTMFPIAAARRRDLDPYLIAVLVAAAFALQTRLAPFKPSAVEPLPYGEVAVGSAPMESLPPPPAVPVPALPPMPAMATAVLPMESAAPEDLGPMGPAAAAPLLGGGSIGRIGALPHPGLHPGQAKGAGVAIGPFDRRAVMAQLLHFPFAGHPQPAVPLLRRPGPAVTAKALSLAHGPTHGPAPGMEPRDSRAPLVLRSGLSGNAFTRHGWGPPVVGGPTAPAGAGSHLALNGSDIRPKP